MKWVLGVVVIVIIAALLWMSGLFGGSQQSATVSVNNQNSALPDATYNSAIASIDAQIASVSKQIDAMGKTPTKAQISATASGFQGVANSMTALVVPLKARITNAQTSGVSVAPATAALADLGRQVANMTSQAGVATKNATATSSNSATLLQSQKQLQTALTFLKGARADFTTIAHTLNIQGGY